MLKGLKTIFFAGFKGGTGKTTLAVSFCRFLKYYEGKSVSLVDMNDLGLLDVLQYDYSNSKSIEVCSHQGQIDREYLQSFSDLDYLVVDCPSIYSSDYLLSFGAADYFVLPFQYSILDYYMLESFVQVVLKTGRKLYDLFLLPNQYSDRLYYQSNSSVLVNQNKKLQKIGLLPPIPRSARFSDLAFGPPDPTLLNYIRPSFIQIIKKITI